MPPRPLFNLLTGSEQGKRGPVSCSPPPTASHRLQQLGQHPRGLQTPPDFFFWGASAPRLPLPNPAPRRLGQGPGLGTQGWAWGDRGGSEPALRGVCCPPAGPGCSRQQPAQGLGTRILHEDLAQGLCTSAVRHSRAPQSCALQARGQKNRGEEDTTRHQSPLQPQPWTSWWAHAALCRAPWAFPSSMRWLCAAQGSAPAPGRSVCLSVCLPRAVSPGGCANTYPRHVEISLGHFQPPEGCVLAAVSQADGALVPRRERYGAGAGSCVLLGQPWQSSWHSTARHGTACCGMARPHVARHAWCGRQTAPAPLPNSLLQRRPPSRHHSMTRGHGPCRSLFITK